MTETATEAVTEKRDLFLVQDGLHGRPIGTYLDNEERRQAEVNRARLEGRKPVTGDKLPPSVGTMLVIDEFRPDLRNTSNPASMLMPKDVDPSVKGVEFEVEPPASEVDLSGAAQVARERQAQQDALIGTEGANDGPDEDDKTVEDLLK